MRIDVRGTPVEVLEQGDGPPVILLHCSGSSSTQWRAMAAKLSGRYRVLAPDLWGYGATPAWPGHEPFSLAADGAIVRALLDHAGEPAHLVGHSFGGAIALHVARRHGERLLSLTVIEPAAFHVLPRQAEVAEVGHGIQLAIACGDYMGGMEQFLDYWSPGSWAAVPPAKRPALAARLVRVGLDFHAAFHEPAGLRDYAGVELPTLLVQGTNSPSPGRTACELLARTLPRAGLETIEGAGHMCPLSHAEAVNALIAAHIDDVQLREMHHARHENNRHPFHRPARGLRELA